MRRISIIILFLFCSTSLLSASTKLSNQAVDKIQKCVLSLVLVPTYTAFDEVAFQHFLDTIGRLYSSGPYWTVNWPKASFKHQEKDYSLSVAKCEDSENATILRRQIMRYAPMSKFYEDISPDQRIYHFSKNTYIWTLDNLIFELKTPDDHDPEIEVDVVREIVSLVARAIKNHEEIVERQLERLNPTSETGKSEPKQDE